MNGMRVLHFVPSLKAVMDSAVMGYKAALFEAMARCADVMVLTMRGSGPVGNVKVLTCPSSVSLPWRMRRFFNGRLAEFRPDIVHIHACWSVAAYCAFLECRRKGIPVVVTLDRQLEDWHVRRRYWLCKLPALLLFQHRMLSRVGALHFVCGQEFSRFSSFGWHPSLKAGVSLNARTVVIEPFSLSAGESADDMCRRMLSFYRKVVDSDPFGRMDISQLKVEDTLLAIGMWGVSTSSGSLGAPDAMKCLDAEAWRRICLHAYDEGILDYVAYGMKALGIGMPFADVGAVERFSPVPAGNGGVGFAPGNRDSGGTKDGAAVPGLEDALCAEVSAFLAGIRRGVVRRADFVRLCQTLRSADYDEDAVCCRLGRLGLLSDAARLMQIMKERYGLTEGYMFTDPLDDRRTGVLRRKLFKSKIQ